MLRRNLIVLTCLLLMSSVAAQDDTFPPDPATIFTDTVEVIDVQEGNLINFRPSNTFPQVDNERRVLSVWDVSDEIWHEYPYPDEVNTFSRSGVGFVDGYVILSHQPPDDVSDYVWLFDTESETFSPYETPCGDLSIGEYPTTFSDDITVDLDGWWAFIDTADGISICQTKTGERYGSLPLTDDFVFVKFVYLRAEWDIEPFPNDNRFVMHGISENRDYAIYTYDPDADTVTFINSVDYRDWYGFDEWLTDTQAVFSTGGMPESVLERWHFVDLTQPGSMYSLRDDRSFGDYIEGRFVEGRYEYLYTYSVNSFRVGAFSEQVCKLQVARHGAAELAEYVLGDDCGGFVRVNEDAYYYVSFELDEDGVPEDERECLTAIWSDPVRFGEGACTITESTLYRLNPNTGESEAILTDEIEWLEGVSSDEHYAALIVDDSGAIDTINKYAAFEIASILLGGFQWNTDIPNAYRVVFDLVDNRIVYEIADSLDSPFTWLNENTGYLYHHSLIKFQEEQFDSFELSNGNVFLETVSIDRQEVVVSIDRESPVGAFNLDSWQFTPIINYPIDFLQRADQCCNVLLADTDYRIRFDRREDDTLYVVLEEIDVENPRAVTYIIRIADTEG